MNTLKTIEDSLQGVNTCDLARLKEAYEQTLKLRSQLLSVIYDIENFGYKAENESKNAFCNDYTGDINNGTVVLSINEPLPLLKELTAAVEEHWIELLNSATEQAMEKTHIYFEKAFIEIEVITPRGTNNSKLWDTSNRAINVIINNLKGIYFKDDNFEHMAFSIVGRWEETGRTIIKISDFSSQKVVNS